MQPPFPSHTHSTSPCFCYFPHFGGPVESPSLLHDRKWEFERQLDTHTHTHTGSFRSVWPSVPFINTLPPPNSKIIYRKYIITNDNLVASHSSEVASPYPWRRSGVFLPPFCLEQNSFPCPVPIPERSRPCQVGALRVERQKCILKPVCNLEIVCSERRLTK